MFKLILVLCGLQAIFLIFLGVLISRLFKDKFRDFLVKFEFIEKQVDKTERTIKDEFQRNREEAQKHDQQHREEATRSFQTLNESLLKRMVEISTLQKNQLDSFSKQIQQLSQRNDQRLDTMRETIEKRLHVLQTDNNKKLEEMRSTVDEKLHATLEKRLGQSFKVVSERLEQVHKGLGEMQTLASGVGDLKKVLTNVKTRGVWGEIQLGQLLDQVLTSDQYECNVKTKKESNDHVEYAIKLPGQSEDSRVWLPIDAKFPQESYQRLLDAQDRADAQEAELHIKQLENQLKLSAKEIQSKYIDPPHTTDFGLLFLPVEGLYAEVLRIPGLCEELQLKYRIMVAGPTTLAALLNSLQMGFRTLAIEKRSSEVWRVLGLVKSEFGKFGDILDKTQKKLQEAGNTIETAARKSRTIERKLRSVEEVSMPTVSPVLETKKDQSLF